MEQKLLSIAIPCYNSEDYMENCIKSLLAGGEEVEIIIVDDGSKDRTSEIADEYAANYPTIIKAVHQENGGHGEAVNAGLRNASGLYFKVVDSDDWVNEEAYMKILKTLREQDNNIDMLISNYVYEKQAHNIKSVMKYDSYLPVNRIFAWDEIRKMPIGKYLLMHSVIYKTQILRDCNLSLPKHTFYVDNIFVYDPLPFVKNIYYLNVDFYRYFIGRDDQSVNEKIMISRLDQQIRVNLELARIFLKHDVKEVNLRKYMLNYLIIITVISSILAIRSKDPEKIEQKRKLWSDLNEIDEELYKAIRYSPLGRGVNLPGRPGRKIAVSIYKIAQKVYGFN